MQILPSGSNTVKQVVKETFTWYGMKEEITSLHGFIIIPQAQNGAPPRCSPTHPYHYTILLIFHHALFDGITWYNISHVFIRTLNQVLYGRLINDSVKQGELVSNEEINELEEILANSSQNIIPKESLYKPVILKSFPPPGGQNPSTNFLFKNVEPDGMATIKDACKREGVTLHTALMAAHQTATINLLQESGVQEDTVTFCVNMPTDLRRYLAKRSLTVQGLFAATIKIFIETNITQRCSLWNLGRYIEEKKKKYIDSKEIIRQLVAQRMAAKESQPVCGPPSLKFDYAISSIPLIVSDSSNIVQVIGGNFYVFVHNTYNMSFLTYQSYNGRYVFTFSYASNFLAEKTAVMLLDKTFHILQDKCQT